MRQIQVRDSEERAPPLQRPPTAMTILELVHELWHSSEGSEPFCNAWNFLERFIHIQPS